MNANSELNQMIERFSQFDIGEREYILDIFSKGLREAKREKLYRRYLESKENLEKENVKIGDVGDLQADLEQD